MPRCPFLLARYFPPVSPFCIAANGQPVGRLLLDVPWVVEHFNLGATIQPYGVCICLRTQKTQTNGFDFLVNNITKKGVAPQTDSRNSGAKSLLGKMRSTVLIATV